jgi:HEAT repeat protein
MMKTVAPPQRKGLTLLVWTLVLLQWLILVTCSVLWWKLPVWAPHFVAKQVPFPELVIRAYGEGEVGSTLVLNRLVARGNAVVPMLNYYTQHPLNKYRYLSVMALGKINPPEVALTLIPLLQDPDDTVRLMTIDALKNLRDERAIPALVSLLREQHAFRMRVVEALQAFPSAVVADACVPLLSERNSFALLVLGKSQDPRVPHWLNDEMRLPETLSALPAGETSWQELAGNMLGHQTHPSGEPYILSALHDPQGNIRCWVLTGLLQEKQQLSEAVVEQVLNNLHHPQGDVAKAAALVCHKQDRR